MPCRLPTLLLALALLCPLLTACGAAPDNPAAGPQVLRWSIEGMAVPPDVDPPLAGNSQQTMINSLIFGGLVRLDSRLNVRPFGAERWELSSDGRVYTFYLRPGLKFADGAPVVAADFAYSLNRAFSLDKSGGNAGYYLGNITGSKAVSAGSSTTVSGIKVVDDSTLQISLDHPASYFLYQLSYATSSVVPRKLVEQGGNWQARAFGIGPFVRAVTTDSNRLVLKPNPYYSFGKPGLAEIDLIFYPAAHTAFADYQADRLDVMGTIAFDPSDVDAASKLDGYLQASQFNVTYLGFNNSRAPFDNAGARQALAQAVGKQTIASNTLSGLVIAADTIIPPGMPGYNSAIQKLPFDLVTARSLLAAAGVKAGDTIRLTINDQDASYLKVANYLQQTWESNLGVKVQVDSVGLTDFNNSLNALTSDPQSSPLQVYLSVWSADYPDPQNFLSQQLRSGAGNNNGHFSNPQFDALVDKADVETNATERLRLYSLAEQIAVNQVGWLPLYYGKANALINPRVKGLTYTAQGLQADDWARVTTH